MLKGLTSHPNYDLSATFSYYSKNYLIFKIMKNLMSFEEAGEGGKKPNRECGIDGDEVVH